MGDAVFRGPQVFNVSAEADRLNVCQRQTIKWLNHPRTDFAISLPL